MANGRIYYNGGESGYREILEAQQIAEERAARNGQLAVMATKVIEQCKAEMTPFQIVEWIEIVREYASLAARHAHYAGY